MEHAKRGELPANARGRIAEARQLREKGFDIRRSYLLRGVEIARGEKLRVCAQIKGVGGNRVGRDILLGTEVVEKFLHGFLHCSGS